MKDILLIGAGGHCQSCIDVIEQIGGWRIAGIVDSKESSISDVMGYPVIGTDENLSDLRRKYDRAFVTIGQITSAEIRIRLFKKLKSLGFKQPTFVSPFAYVSKHAIVGDGTIIMHHALINTNAKIGNNCIINTKALIEHGAVVQDHCHISTGAIINGEVIIGEQSFIGSRVVTKQTVSIPTQSFIKAGSLVK